MKILTQKTEVLSSKGAETTQFKIAATSKAFAILSSNLYTDKITAIIRELSTNAVDAHIAAKTEHQQFEVGLPTTWEQQFSIRDFGTGLSRDQIEHLYTTYFESDKTHSDDFVGGLGLGSKSPFSYTDNFTVVSYHNGEKHIYSMCIEDGYPACKHLISEETTEPNGLEITLATNNDHQEWQRKAAEVYKYFDRIKPKFVSGAITITPPDYERKNDKWAIMRGASNTMDMHVVMGGVCYKISHNSVDKNKIKMPVGGMTMFANVGEVEIQASRESLHMDHRTVEFINNRIDDYLEETRANLQKELDACTSNWYVYKTLVGFRRKNEQFHTNVMDIFFKEKKLKYKGVVISSYPQISVADMWNVGKQFKMEYVSRSWNKWSKDSAGYTLNPHDIDLIVINDTGRKNVDKRVYSNIENRKFNRCLFVSFYDVLEAQVVPQTIAPVSTGQATVMTPTPAPKPLPPKVLFKKEDLQKEFLQTVGLDANCPMILYVSTMPAHVAGTNRKYNAPSKVVEFRPLRDGNGVANRAYWNDVEITLGSPTHKEVWYVPVFESSGVYNTTGNVKDDEKIDPDNIKTMLRMYEKFTGKTILLYGIRQRSLEKMEKDNPGVLKNFFTEFFKQLSDQITKHDLVRKVGTFMNLRYTPVLGQDIIDKIKQNLDAGQSDFHKHFEAVTKVKKDVEDVSAFAVEFYELCRQNNHRFFKKEHDVMHKIANGKKMMGDDIQGLEKKYPMLGVAGYQRSMSLDKVKSTIQYINLVNRS